MTDEILHSLRDGVVNGKLTSLISIYPPDATLESHVNGRREVCAGPSAIEGKWAELIHGPGMETHFLVAVEPGGYDIDVQRSSPTGDRQIRLLHRLHVVDGWVRRHLVYPAPPNELTSLPVDVLPPAVSASATAFAHEGLSGAALFRAHLENGEPVVIKYVRPQRDWMARATRDPGREALLFTEGVYDRLPRDISSPVIRAERVEDGWVLVMRDVHTARDNVRTGDQRDMSETMLAAVHSMHTRFTGSGLGGVLTSPEDRIRLFSPLRPLVERHGCDTLPKTLTTTWEFFVDQAEPALADAVLRLVADPHPLLRALTEAASSTLLHGDYRPANLGLDGRTVLALDWGLACYGPAQLDFVWFLSNVAWGDDAERGHLESIWQRLTGDGPTSRISDLAVIFHAVMGEVAFLMTEAAHQPPGFPKPSDDTVKWWLRRLTDALDRVGDLSRPESNGGSRTGRPEGSDR